MSDRWQEVDVPESPRERGRENLYVDLAQMLGEKVFQSSSVGLVDH